jgi:hypothetical protein
MFVFFIQINANNIEMNTLYPIIFLPNKRKKHILDLKKERQQQKDIKTHSHAPIYMYITTYLIVSKVGVSFDELILQSVEHSLFKFWSSDGFSHLLQHYGELVTVSE